jgi:hypothetical protein
MATNDKAQIATIATAKAMLAVVIKPMVEGEFSIFNISLPAAADAIATARLAAAERSIINPLSF